MLLSLGYSIFKPAIPLFRLSLRPVQTLLSLITAILLAKSGPDSLDTVLFRYRHVYRCGLKGNTTYELVWILYFGNAYFMRIALLHRKIPFFKLIHNGGGLSIDNANFN